MNWFQGEIAEAVAASKTKQAIFVVYIEGSDENSVQFTEIINSSDISAVLGSDKFVAIKIESGSVSHQQFEQIYKEIHVPSMYFIGRQGLPLEIITEAKNVKVDNLNLVLQKGGLSPIAIQSNDFLRSEQAATSAESSSPAPQPHPEPVCENGVCTIKKTPTSSPDKKDTQTPTSSPPKTEEKPKEKSPAALPTPKEESPAAPPPTVEDKVERAKEIVEKQREEKAKEEEESERQKELERRKMGQNVQQLKRWQDEQELKNVLEERQKEKRETQAARDRVLAQIAQDKAERAAKFSNSPPQSTSAAPATTQPSPRVVNTNQARIQFRMPDGSTATNDFSSADPLESVHAHIKAHLQLPFKHYTLSTTFPRREFTESDRSQSLLDLGLAPTSVVLILPINRGAITTNVGGGGLTGMLWTLLTPFFSILGYLKSFVFGGGGGSSGQKSGEGGSKRSAEASGSEPGRSQAKVRRGPGETTVIKRQGNVHRLGRSDSDDENNTWNGNSTQQM